MELVEPVSRVRREPPRFRWVAVRRVARRSLRLVGITVAGPELEGFVLDEPAASVRLLLPEPGERRPAQPAWNGNEFLLADGRRPLIRTLTPRRFDAEALELDLEVVIHGDGAASAWAEAATSGDEVAVSGPGRGYGVDPDASSFLLAGDETAIPAISQLLEVLDAEVSVRVRIEVAAPTGRLELPQHPGAQIEWCDLAAGATPGDALVVAVRAAQPTAEEKVWVAGEAAAVQRIRRHLFEERGLTRSSVHVRGYWKTGRSESG